MKVRRLIEILSHLDETAEVVLSTHSTLEPVICGDYLEGCYESGSFLRDENFTDKEKPNAVCLVAKKNLPISQADSLKVLESKISEEEAWQAFHDEKSVHRFRNDFE